MRHGSHESATPARGRYATRCTGPAQGIQKTVTRLLHALPPGCGPGRPAVSARRRVAGRRNALVEPRADSALALSGPPSGPCGQRSDRRDDPAVRLTLRTHHQRGRSAECRRRGTRRVVRGPAGTPSAPLGVMGIHLPGTNSIEPARAAQTSCGALCSTPTSTTPTTNRPSTPSQPGTRPRRRRPGPAPARPAPGPHRLQPRPHQPRHRRRHPRAHLRTSHARRSTCRIASRVASPAERQSDVPPLLTQGLSDASTATASHLAWGTVKGRVNQVLARPEPPTASDTRTSPFRAGSVATDADADCRCWP